MGRLNWVVMRMQEHCIGNQRASLTPARTLTLDPSGSEVVRLLATHGSHYAER